MKCRRCEKEFDPSYEFYEDVDALEALMFFGDIEDLCPECISTLIAELTEHILKYKKES